MNREFITHTGYYKGKHISVLSTGIGTDNIDIVLNELDAAVNIDLEKRIPNKNRKSLNVIRIGTSGAIQKDIPVGSFVISDYGLGFDGLFYYYKYHFDPYEAELTDQAALQLNWPSELSKPYCIAASGKLIKHLEAGMVHGITATATGFYGPQGRKLVLDPSIENLNERLTNFSFREHRITNFEMETSSLYALSKLLGHHACTCCAIIANRYQTEFSEDKNVVIDNLISTVLKRIVDLD